MDKRTNWKAGLLRLFSALLIATLAFGQLLPARPAQAAPGLSVTPITWNIVGLDSNNVNVGPNDFPVGARVCNTDTAAPATHVVSDFNWATSSDPYINTRTGTSTSYGAPGVTLATAGTSGDCKDFYYEIEITRDPAAYNQTRLYTITASSSEITTPVSTPTPREIFVEKLISQSRNAVLDVLLDGTSILPGRTMNLQVGGTYTITLVGSTAPGGYNQLESFINLPNTIFQINSVTSTYETTTLPGPHDMLYADSCGWDNNSLSPTYRSCVVSDGKTGGHVTAAYNITVISGGGTTQALNSLLYDFSGSSFHYNSNFSEQTRYASIVNQVAFSKAFSPVTITPNSPSALTFTLFNNALAPVSAVSFSDTLPGSLVITTPAATSSGCNFSSTPTLTAIAGTASIAFSGASIAAGGTCTVTVQVTTPAVGTYPNVSGPLFVNAADTGLTANAVLTVAANLPGTGCSGQTIASFTSWFTDDITYFAANPRADLTSLVTATVFANSSLAAKVETVAQYGNPNPGWSASGWPNAQPLSTATTYIQFSVDTSQYNDNSVKMVFDALFKNPNGPTSVDVYTSIDGTSWTLTSNSPLTITTAWASYTGTPSGFQTNPTGTTYFRLYAYGAKNSNVGSDLVLDNVIFTGCSKPTITKQFLTNPVAVGGISPLLFTLHNPNSTPLTGVAFSDALPTGLQVVNPPAPIFAGCGSPDVSAANNATTIDFSGGTLGANGTCTLQVSVTALSAGAFPNVTGYISSAETGTTQNYGSDTLRVLSVNPGFSKNFGPNPIHAGETTTLTFVITNYNSVPLPGVAFTDALPSVPAQMIVANPAAASTVGCGTPTFAPAPDATTLSFAGGTIAAGSTCTVKVNVTAPVDGDYVNTTSALTTAVPGIGAGPASDTLRVLARHPGLELLKQVATSLSGPWTSFIRVQPGAPIYYRLTVENTGDVDLTNVSVSDPSVTLTGCSLITPFTLTTANPIASCIIGPLAAVVGDHQNTAVAQALYNGSPLTSASMAEYLAEVITNGDSLSLVKQISTSPFGLWASSTSGLTPSIYIRFIVINTGNTVLHSLVISDDQLGTVECEFIDPLAPGLASVCVVGPVIVQSSPYTNTAHAEALNPGEDGVISNDSTATYTLIPTAVTLVNFSASTQSVFAARLEWTAAMEIDVVGYNLLRSQSYAGPWQPVNATLIPAQAPGSLISSTYTLVDPFVQPGVKYIYRLDVLEAKTGLTTYGYQEYMRFFSFLPAVVTP